MIKGISTRNSIIILNENYNKYNTESLFLLILKECLKNFYVDDNLVQMFEKEEIDLTKLDRFIECGCERELDKIQNSIYLYQEDDSYNENIKSEIEKLQKNKIFSDYDIKAIKGNFNDIIHFLNKNQPFAVCMYTKNPKIAYEYMNWVNCPNVFINCGINNCKKKYNFENNFFNLKNICHKDVF